MAMWQMITKWIDDRAQPQGARGQGPLCHSLYSMLNISCLRLTKLRNGAELREK